jgi:hypothetical protein
MRYQTRGPRAQNPLADHRFAAPTDVALSHGKSPPLRRKIDRLLDALHAWWRRLWMDDLSAFLAQSSDHVDLEDRLRRWHDANQRDRTPLR